MQLMHKDDMAFLLHLFKELSTTGRVYTQSFLEQSFM